MKPEVKEILDKINTLKKELESIQDNCQHEEYSVELIEGSLKRICKSCKKNIGYASQEDLEESGYI